MTSDKFGLVGPELCQFGSDFPMYSSVSKQLLLDPLGIVFPSP